jgi:hypothetical protein
MIASHHARAWSGAVVISLALAGCGAAAPSSDTRSTANASPMADVRASSETSVGGTTGLDGAVLHGVAVAGDHLVAVGSDGQAAAWTSNDGVAWHSVEVADASDVDALHAVALAGEGEGVAFGATDLDPSRMWSPAVGTSPWAPVEAGGIDGRVNAVAMDAGRWVAVGDLVDHETGMATAGAAWTSDDGRRWERLAELPLNEGTISDVVITGETAVVAGFDVDGGRMWTSRDGGDLESVDDGEFDAASIEGIARGNAGYVALGRTLADLRPVVWTSEDGVSWTRTAVSGDTFPPDLQINDLAAFDGALVAVGAAPDGGVLWTSRDGRSWTVHTPESGATGG